jgi:short-subunit dehydrogenase
MQRILIIGATSAIAEATSRVYAQRGATLFLVGRNRDRLDAIAQDLRTRGAAQVEVAELDVNALDHHAAMIEGVWATLGGVDTTLIAHGTLPIQSDCDASPVLALAEFATNGTATIALCAQIGLRLRNGDTLAVISSVAGDRGRASNYLYGSAKAAVSTYLSGMRQRLRPQGVNVLTIKPGFVDTPMTAGFKKGVLWAKPDSIAKGIVAAIDRRRSVVYLPGFWWAIMQVIKLIPEPIFVRIKL